MTTGCPFGDRHAIDTLMQIEKGMGTMNASIAVVATKVEHVTEMTASSLDMHKATDGRLDKIEAIALAARRDAEQARKDADEIRTELDAYRTWLLRATIGGVGGALLIIGQTAWDWAGQHINLTMKP
jgi:uncharacterized membrane protein YjjP (DUF1212 family)